MVECGQEDTAVQRGGADRVLLGGLRRSLASNMMRQRMTPATDCQACEALAGGVCDIAEDLRRIAGRVRARIPGYFSMVARRMKSNIG